VREDPPFEHIYREGCSPPDQTNWEEMYRRLAAWATYYAPVARNALKAHAELRAYMIRDYRRAKAAKNYVESDRVRGEFKTFFGIDIDLVTKPPWSLDGRGTDL
jgi:hypothetical protein